MRGLKGRWPEKGCASSNNGWVSDCLNTPLPERDDLYCAVRADGIIKLGVSKDPNERMFQLAHEQRARHTT